jgi:Family of unknown function (DUF6785)/Domain of unknown function (DUF6784)
MSSSPSGVRPVTSDPPFALRGRVSVLALLLIPLNVYWVLSMQVGWNQGYPTMLSLFFNVVFILFVLVLANRLLLHVAPRQALSQAELLTLYTALAMATAAAQFVEYLVPVVAGPFALARTQNGVLAWLSAPLARLLTVRDADAARALATGGSGLGPFLALWIVPFLGWTLFVGVLLTTTLCLGTLFYRQWTENERLPFPIVQIPLQMTADGGRDAFRNPLFWTGFAVAGGLIAWNGVAAFIPGLPALPIKRQFYDGFTQASVPFNALGRLSYSFHPFVIGLGYFLPLDLTFSIGAFYWLHQLVRLGASAAGLGADNPRFPYVDFQSFGAWIALFVIAVWFARRHLSQALGVGRWVSGVGRWALGVGHWVHWPGLTDRTDRTDQSDPSETPNAQRLTPNAECPTPMSYRAAFLGAAAGFLFLCVFGMLLGLSWWASVVFFGIYFSVVTAMAKARAELGPPAVDLFLTAPGKVMVALFGGKLLGPGTLVSLSLLYWLWLEYPWHPMPHQLEALRLCDPQGAAGTRAGGPDDPATVSFGIGRRPRNVRWDLAALTRPPASLLATADLRRGASSSPHRRMAWLMMAAALLGWTVAFLVVLQLDYSAGAATARQGGTQAYYARQAYSLPRNWLNEMAPPDRAGVAAMVVGGLITGLLALARVQIVGWPLHPVGYALGSAFTTSYLWLPLWISALAKGLIVHYGGLATYRRFMPLFLGLVLGEFVIGSLWAILGVTTRLPVYVFWPY